MGSEIHLFSAMNMLMSHICFDILLKLINNEKLPGRYLLCSKQLWPERLSASARRRG